jgi:transposase-like protein
MAKERKRRINLNFETKLKIVKQWISGKATSRELSDQVGMSYESLSASLSRWRDKFIAQGYLTHEEGFPMSSMGAPMRSAQLTEQKPTFKAQPSVENKMEMLDLKDKLLNAMMENATLRTRIVELESLLGTAVQDAPSKTKRR